MAAKQETQIVELEKLVPYDNNPNVHPEDQVKAISESIERYGQYYPIVVDENYNILCGHGKKMALESLGHKTAEVRVLYGLTKKQKLKLVIEDNKIQSMSYVNYGKIDEIIKEIGELDIIGFDERYLDAIINETTVDNMGVDFAAPVEKKSNVQQIESVPQEKKSKQDQEFIDIDEGVQPARTMRCPHCGQEIVL